MNGSRVATKVCSAAVGTRFLVFKKVSNLSNLFEDPDSVRYKDHALVLL